MAEEKQRRPIIGFISACLITAGLAGVAVAIINATQEYDLHSADQASAIRAQTEEMTRGESHKTQAEKDAAYLRLTEAAAKIAAMKSAGANAAQLQDQVTQFRSLAWGPAAVTGGPGVNSALALFNDALDADADGDQLQQLSMDLARICANESHAAARTPGQPAPEEIYGSDEVLLGKMREVVRGPAAQHAASLWLALVDSGKYSESWKSAASSFQSTATQDQWDTRIAGLRKALGSAGSRKFKGQDPGKSPQDTEHVVLQYDTSFDQKSDAVESVTVAFDKDGAWRVSAYSVK